MYIECRNHPHVVLCDLSAPCKTYESKHVRPRTRKRNKRSTKQQHISKYQDLRRERAKLTALVEELELPLNVHRWRKLESSDPERYDLVRKAQSLQRNIVAKTESIIKKDLLIQEKVRARERMVQQLCAWVLFLCTSGQVLLCRLPRAHINQAHLYGSNT